MDWCWSVPKKLFDPSWIGLPMWCILLSLLFLVGCGAHLGQDDKISDKNEEILAQVKLALVKNTRIDAAPLDVEVNKGVVTLSGFVEDEEQREQAIKVAENIKGVRSVLNKIQIK